MILVLFCRFCYTPKDKKKNLRGAAAKIPRFFRIFRAVRNNKRNYLEPSHISLTLVFISSIWPCLPQTVAGYVRAQGKSAQADGKSASYRIGTQAPAKRSNSSFL